MTEPATQIEPVSHIDQRVYDLYDEYCHGFIDRREFLARARAQGLSIGAHLARNDAYGFFSAVDGLVVTGPTFTNVNDFRAVLVLPPRAGG